MLVEIDVDGTGAFGVLGIGGVFVTPSARGRGLVSPLLERLLVPDRVLVAPAERAVDRAMLFCRPPLMALYGKSAFVEVSATVTASQPEGRIEMPLRAMWRPLRDHASWPAGPVAVRGLPF